MKKFLFFLIVANVATAQNAHELVLDKALKYHDPEGEWSNLKATFLFAESRPNGSDRSSTIVLDNSISYMKLNRNDEEIYEVKDDSCAVLAGDKEVARGLMLRNYYLYLWGLPMKLTDPGTPFDQSVAQKSVKGKMCDVIRIEYEEDTWYFYIDQESGKMMEYRFYKDEANGKGELIKLEDEIMVGSIKIPQKRSWYKLPEMKYLGTDILTAAQ